MKRPRRLALVAGLAFTIVACGGSDAAPAQPAATETVAPAGVAADGIVLVSAEEAASTVSSPPEDLVILDVRTAEEFAEGHIDGAVMLDFYRDDFADELAKLDPDVPYVLYCRSGNRSGQAAVLMEQLGFGSVENVDGGIIAWQQAGLPVVAD